MPCFCLARFCSSRRYGSCSWDRHRIPRLSPEANSRSCPATEASRPIHGFSTAPVPRMLLISLGMALAIAFGKIIISVLSAFAIAFFRFPGRLIAFWLIFITLMLPVEVRIIPTYSVMADLGLINTFTGLWLPLIASATATLLFRQVFVAIPDELVEAARMDGAGPLRFLRDIVIPVSGAQYRGLIRYSVRIRMESISLAVARRDQSEARYDRHWHRQNGRGRNGNRLERRDGDGDARLVAAHRGRYSDAAMVCRGSDRGRKINGDAAIDGRAQKLWCDGGIAADRSDAEQRRNARDRWRIRLR